MAFKITTANKILDKILRNTNFTHPAAVYISLHTGAPGEDGADEVTGGSYGRQAGAFSEAANKASANTGAISFEGMPACTVTHFGLWDASSGGNFWWGGALDSSKAVGAGDTVAFSAGDLDVVLT